MSLNDEFVLLAASVILFKKKLKEENYECESGTKNIWISAYFYIFKEIFIHIFKKFLNF